MRNTIDEFSCYKLDLLLPQFAENELVSFGYAPTEQDHEEIVFQTNE